LITLPALDEGRVGRGLAAGVAGSGAGMEASVGEGQARAGGKRGGQVAGGGEASDNTKVS
jgi:hypothetical protein